MIATVDGWFAPEYRDDIRALGHEIHDTVAGFVRGQIVICLVLAVLYATALKLTGLNHAILIGIAAGLISFVPYLGAATGIVVSVCVALDQFWPNWAPVVVVGGIFIVGETLADYVLSPRLIGRRVNLNPVWMMFALFAFGWLFGFIGVLLAIPIAASLGVILRFARRKSPASAGHNVSTIFSAFRTFYKASNPRHWPSGLNVRLSFAAPEACQSACGPVKDTAPMATFGDTLTTDQWLSINPTKYINYFANKCSGWHC